MLAFPSGIQLPDFPLNVFVLLLLVVLLLLRQGGDEGLELLAGLLGHFLFRLGLLYGPDGILDLTVGRPDDFLGFFPGPVKNLLLGLLYLLQFLLVLVRNALQSPVGILYLRQLLVEGFPVAGNLAQVPLYADKFLAGTGLGILDDIFGQPHFPGKLKCE